MEEKNELSDIILDKKDNKLTNIKKILMVIAGLIIIFLIAIVIMKAFNTDKKKNEYDLLLPPEPKATKKSNNEEFFKQVPIIQEDNDKQKNFDEMVKKLKEKETQKTKEENQTKTTKSEPAQAKEVAQKIIKEAPKQVTQVKKTPIKKVAKQTTAPVQKTSKSLKASRGIYIQIGATAQVNPDKKFLKKISAGNYEYKLHRVNVKGKTVTKILIGPYSTLSKAKANIKDVKLNINKNAFIYRVR